MSTNIRLSGDHWRINIRGLGGNHGGGGHFFGPYNRFGGHNDLFSNFNRPSYRDCHSHSMCEPEERGGGFHPLRNIGDAFRNLFGGVHDGGRALVHGDIGHAITSPVKGVFGFVGGLFGGGSSRHDYRDDSGPRYRDDNFNPRHNMNSRFITPFSLGDHGQKPANFQDRGPADNGGSREGDAISRMSTYGVDNTIIDASERANPQNLNLIAKESAISADVIKNAKGNINTEKAQEAYYTVKAELEQALEGKIGGLSGLNQLQINKGNKFFADADAAGNKDQKLNGAELKSLFAQLGMSNETLTSLDKSDSFKLGAANAAADMLASINGRNR